MTQKQILEKIEQKAYTEYSNYVFWMKEYDTEIKRQWSSKALEKANILIELYEDITGKDIYLEISKKAWNLYDEEMSERKTNPI